MKHDARVDNKPDTRAKFLICSGEIDWTVTHGPLKVQGERVLAYADDFGEVVAEMVKRPDATFIKALSPDLNGDLKYHIFDRVSLGYKVLETFNRFKQHLASPPTVVGDRIAHIQV